ncbi:MAG: GAF domain-containing protein [Rickettsiales bacterium]|nr:GAF domain-containing protein [Rickettsiales bacterium]
MSTKRNVFGLRLIAILEIIIALVVMVAIDILLGNGDMFWDVNPHPFWLIVILVAAQYGANEGLLAAFFCTLVYLLGEWPARDADADAFNYYYEVLINPILWFIGGLTTGAFSERHIRKIVRLDHELEQSNDREKTITDSYNFVKRRKEDLEVQVAGKLTSSVQAYRAAKSIEKLDPREVMGGIQKLVSAVLNPEKYSVYTLNDGRLQSNIVSGWAGNDAYAKEIEASSSLYQAVVGNQQVLNIANSDHEVILGREGVLAGPIHDPESGKVVGMLKIEQMDFTSLSLNTVETFKALCEWVGSSIVNAENYQSVKKDSVLNPDHNLMTYSFFQRQSDYLSKLAKRVGFDLSMLVIRINNDSSLDDAARITIARQLGESCRSALRNVDLAFEYQTEGDEYSILLPATNQDGAAIVRDKIASDLDRSLRNFGGGNFSYIVQSIHEAA